MSSIINEPMFGSNINDYRINFVLTKCFSDRGVILLTKHIPSNNEIVLKKYAIDNTNAEEYDSIIYEVFALRQLSHPNILQLFVTFVNAENVYLGMPLMDFGSCKDIIERSLPSGFPESLIAVVIKDVLCGLVYLHDHGFVHRSVKASHIFLNGRNAILGGLRDCVGTISQGKKRDKLHFLSPINMSNLNWYAPEVLEQNLLGYNQKSDIFSLGMTCCELINGFNPYFNMEATFMMTEKIKGNIRSFIDQLTYTENNVTLRSAKELSLGGFYSFQKYSDDFQEFTDLCTKSNPNSRWSAKNLLTHSFLKQCKYYSIPQQIQRYNIKEINK